MFQFVHISSYSRATPKKGKTGGHTVASIVNEAVREISSTPHINNPVPPRYVYGKPLEQLEATCDAWAASMTDAAGRKTRKDALCLIAGVISAEDGTSWEKIRDDSTSWLRERYGERLQTVVEHLDEARPHIHFYVVPLPGERFDQVHDGKRAAAAHKGQRKGDQNRAYIEAMRAFQDEYSDRVGIPNGQLRYGPGRRRLTREQWKAEQHQGQSLAKALEGAQETREAARSEAERIRENARQNAKQVASRARSEGVRQGREQFAGKTLFGKLAEMVFGASRENAKLREALQESREEGRGWRGKAERFQRDARRFFKSLGELREENAKLAEKAGGVDVLVKRLRNTEAELDATLNNLSEKTYQLKVARETIRGLDEAELRRRERLNRNNGVERMFHRERDIAPE